MLNLNQLDKDSVEVRSESLQLYGYFKRMKNGLWYFKVPSNSEVCYTVNILVQISQRLDCFNTEEGSK